MSTTSHSPSRTRTYGDERDGGRPQSPGAAEEERRLEYDGLMAQHPPRRNCCTWKVASAFLAMVAVALVVTWQLLPAEDIVARYIPEFPAPEVAYSGPEAGSGARPSSGADSEDDGTGGLGGENGGGGLEAADLPAPGNANAAGARPPSFMTCPSGGGLCCNGNAANCVLPVNEMMFGMVHNSMSTEEGGFLFGANHKLQLEKALVAGYRGLSLDVCNCGGVLQFCHNVCDLGERYPNEVFSNIRDFLNEYPSEVIVLLFEASLEQGPVSWDDLYAEMENVDGFAELLYVHADGAAWPSMGDLVRQNKRIIVFHFNGDRCAEDDAPCPPGYHYFYDHAAETRFDSASLADLEDVEVSCEVTRGPRGGDGPAAFFVVNNFVTPPDEDASAVANSKDFLAQRLTDCSNRNGMRPNFVYLDFWSRGVTAQLVQYANEQHAQQSIR